MKTTVLCVFLFLLTTQLPAAPPLLERLKDENARGQSQWIYNDLQKAMAEGRRTGKPIFVTFRCVPCSDCKAFDAEVAKGSRVIRELAQKHFISLRQVEMKGVDLGLFQFDYDLNWAAMFINAEGVVYGRYGTQSAAGPDAFNSVESLEKAMQRVLKLHAEYPKNKFALVMKRGAAKGYRTPLQMPGMENKAKLRQNTQRNNCIHCHNIHDAENNQLHLTGKMTNDKLWRYPFPDNLGLAIDPKDGQKIVKVATGSAAAKAGLRAGQRITHVAGQPIVSIADIQWVLHNRSNGAEAIRVTVAGSSRSHLVKTAPGWKKVDISWRGSMWNVHPRLRVWMPPATPQELTKLKLPAGQNALKVKWINTGSKEGRAAQKAGLRQGDFIIAIDGEPLGKMTPQQFTTYVKLNYKSGQKLPLTLMRNGRRIQYEWPLQ
jgi:hypothetical protein